MNEKTVRIQIQKPKGVQVAVSVQVQLDKNSSPEERLLDAVCRTIPELKT